MNWLELKELALNIAKERELESGLAGERYDRGASLIKDKVKEFEKKLILKLDLRPSETEKANYEEIGFPYEFSAEIKEWKGLEFYKKNEKLFKRYF